MSSHLISTYFLRSILGSVSGRIKMRYRNSKNRMARYMSSLPLAYLPRLANPIWFLQLTNGFHRLSNIQHGYKYYVRLIANICNLNFRRCWDGVWEARKADIEEMCEGGCRQGIARLPEAKHPQKVANKLE